MRTTVNSGTYPPTQSVDMDLAMAPHDRVRLASVVAGLLTTIAALIVLAVLGIAIGLSQYDANSPNPIGLGTGVWSAISALIAFGLGGFVAARSAITASGSRNGILNGLIMWMAVLFLIVLLLGNGIGALLGVVGNAATAAATAAGPVAAQAVANPGAVAPAASTALSSTVAGVQEQLSPANRERTAQDISNAAWGALVFLALSVAASLIGGAIGSRTDERRTRDTNVPVTTA